MSEDSSQRIEVSDSGQWEALPEDLRKYDQWIVTKNKKPVHPTSGWQKKQNQLTFDDAREEAINADAEIGFVLNGGDPFAVVDLDDVGPPSNHSREVTDIVEKLSTYTEISRSGSGLHIVCRGERLPDRKHKGPLSQRGSIEVYDSNRQIVLTADLFGQLSRITTGGQAFRELQREYLPVDDDADTSTSATETVSTHRGGSIRVQSNTGSNKNGPSVDQIKRTIDAYAADERDEALRAKDLWESSGARKYESSSEADLAFASDLAFWCREDATLMYRCIRRSSRYRSKWDEVHYSDGSTYAEETIGKAIDTNYDKFSGRYVQ
jgi:putative DNA primase/helicase